MTISRLILAVGILSVVTPGVGYACSFLPSQIRYDTLETGVVRVVRVTSGENIRHEYVTTYDTLGISRISSFRSSLESFLRDSSLVFIGRIDSVLQFTNAGDTVHPSITPLFVLRGRSASEEMWPFFARIRLDTVLKGSLPSEFWIRSSMPGTSCDVPVTSVINRTFLNVSGGLSNTTDLKIPTWMTAYHNWPTAHWFDGRYLVSPDYPGLRLDITDVLETYPATGIKTRAYYKQNKNPWTMDSRAYRPDGRTAPSTSGRKTPVPLIKPKR